MEAVAEVKKTTIRPNTAAMVRGAGGSFHKADFIGETLAGLTVEQVMTIADSLGIDTGKYGHLNKGQQRMTVGNALRKVANNEAAKESIEIAAAGFREDNELAASELAAAKAAAKAAKAAAKSTAKAD